MRAIKPPSEELVVSEVPLFESLEELRSAIQTLPTADAQARERARSRQELLTKPQGSLGRLEELAIWLTGWCQGTPEVRRPSVVVFAGNHGVATREVSAYPPEVTVQMVANFKRGGAAVNQLASTSGADLVVVPLWLDEPTGDFSVKEAMSAERFLEAIRIGIASVPADCDLLAVGEMGIGNTTSAAAVCAALLGGDPAGWVGPGTGVDEAGRARKVEVVRKGVEMHGRTPTKPLATAASLGGHELAAILGAVVGARLRSIPVLLDGYISTAAVLPLAMESVGSLDHCLAAHLSPEPGHRRLLDHLGMEPLLNMGMRLGEGSGAALAIPILRAAAACHSGMATFEEADVSVSDIRSPAPALSQPLRKDSD